MSEFNSPGNPGAANPGPIQNPGAVNPGPVQDKWRAPGTDQLAGQAKMTPSGTDPVGGQAKMTPSSTDPLSQVALNPQPLPPTNLSPSSGGGKGGRNPGPIGRGVRNTIIVVCLVGIVLVGGGFVVESARTGTGGATVTFQPGVVQWQHQFPVSSTAKEQMTTSGSAHCASASSLGVLQERLVGGGYTSDDDHGSTLLPQISYPSGNDNWNADFVPQTQGHYATAVAVCLRQPATFFSGLQSFDTVQSSPKLAAADDKHPIAATAVAACPQGESILGGGYMSQHSGSSVFSIDASYPVDANGVAGWSVAFHVEGIRIVQLSAYAICSRDLTTHLEHKAIVGIATRKNPFTRDSMTCASGTLLTGGYQITAAPSLVGIGNDSPLDDSSRTPASGAFVHQWYVEAESSGWQAGVSPGELWVTCLDAQNSATPQPTSPTSPTSQPTSPVVQPTSTPRARPTATPISRPTATPVPACQSILTGGGSMTVDNSYLNVESATGIGHTLTGAQAHWDPASGTIVPVNGAALADQGTIGSTGFSGLTCAQLKSASYTASSVPVADGVVFLVKTPDGRLAKVLIALAPGSLAPALRWETYQP